MFVLDEQETVQEKGFNLDPSFEPAKEMGSLPEKADGVVSYAVI